MLDLLEIDQRENSGSKLMKKKHLVYENSLEENMFGPEKGLHLWVDGWMDDLLLLLIFLPSFLRHARHGCGEPAGCPWA